MFIVTLNQLFLHPLHFANNTYHGKEIDNYKFLDQSCPKSVFPVYNMKNGYHHRIHHI